MKAPNKPIKAGFHYYFGGGYIGGGVQSDELVAKEWLIKAAKQEQKSAIELLNKFYGITKI